MKDGRETDCFASQNILEESSPCLIFDTLSSTFKLVYSYKVKTQNGVEVTTYDVIMNEALMRGEKENSYKNRRGRNENAV